MNLSVPHIDHHTEANLAQRIARAKSRVSRRTQWNAFVLALIGSDVIMAALAFQLAYFIRFELFSSIFNGGVWPTKSFYDYLSLIFLVPLWVILYWVVGLYNRQNLLGGVQEYALIFRATTMSFLIVIIAGFLQPDLIIARGWLLMAWAFTFSTSASGNSFTWPLA